MNYSSRQWPPWWRPLKRRRERRKAACIAAGTYQPELVDLGRRKMCWTCGEW